MDALLPVVDGPLDEQTVVEEPLDDPCRAFPDTVVRFRHWWSST
jgi:hypothetical protein